MNADADSGRPVATQFTIGLLVTNLADRRLLVDFLQQAGYAVQSAAPQAALPAWNDISLILADERAARRHMPELLALKMQDPHIFLPVLIMLPEKSASAFWLNAGFDDVLRLPLRKAELMARLNVLLRIRGDARAQARVRAALQSSEERFRAVFEKAMTGIGITDPHGRFLQVNPALCRFLGYSEAELLHLTIQDITAPADRAETVRQLRAARSGKKQFIDMEKRYRRKDQSLVWGHAVDIFVFDGESAPLYGVAMIQDIDASKAETLARTEAEQKLRTANDELHLLTQKVVTAQEVERKQLARELHDEIGQALTAVNLNLQSLQLSIPDDTVATRLTDSLEIIEHALNQVRDLSLDLHPSILDDLGLVPALQWYLDRQAERTGLAVQFRADSPESNLPPEVQTTCFRITQEAITNIVRHANAHQVRVELYQTAAKLELVIRDDGAGFDVQAARRVAARGTSLGLIGMQERVTLIGGRLALKSAPGAGTELRVRFPLPAASASHARGRRRKTRHNTT